MVEGEVKEEVTVMVEVERGVGRRVEREGDRRGGG